MRPYEVVEDVEALPDELDSICRFLANVAAKIPVLFECKGFMRLGGGE